MEDNGIRQRSVDAEKDLKENEDFQAIAIDRLRKMAKDLRKTCMDQMDKSLRQMVDDMMHEIEHSSSKTRNSLLLNNNSSIKSNRNQLKSGSLPIKQFASRPSLLTEMFESEHIQTIYHIFIAFLMLLFINTVIYDYIDTGKINLDFELIQWAFAQFPTAMAIWGSMFFSTLLLVYPSYQYWATHRHLKSELWDYAWIILYVLYICMFFYFPVLMTVEYDLPVASSAIVLIEQARFLMKIHAFVRSNISRALKLDPKKNDNELSRSEVCPDFSKFLYFMFAPTLVYQDTYPRCTQIRWKYVISNFGQVIGCLFYTHFVFVRFCVPYFHKFGQEPMSPKHLFLSVFGSMLPSMLVLLCTFFAILHAWQNAFAEMLKFSDRMFYKDWWNSTSFANYYRTWNLIVHDWLYTYIYSDLYLLTRKMPYGKVFSTLSVFAISAVVHEFILAFMLKFFYPVLLVLFGVFGALLVFVNGKNKASRHWNVLLWANMFVGTGLLLSLYSMEYYARINCPPVSESLFSTF